MDVNSLTEKQRKAFDQFKTDCKECIRPYHADSYLLKWLKAREFNAKQSSDMFKKSMAWRKRIGADNLVDNWNPPEVLKKYYAGGPGGFDKDGYPVWIDLASYMDFKGLLHSAKKCDIVKYEARQIEIVRKCMEEQTKKLGKTIDQVTVIMDVGRMSMKHLWSPGISCFNEIMEMSEANYPDNLRSIYIINAPRLFPIGFNMVKPLLAEETRQKIHVLGSNWKEKIRESVDPQHLPKQWGGDMTDPDGDPCCKSKICLGGEVPKSFYLKEQQAVTADHFINKTVERGSVFQVRLEVTLPGSAIRWEFRTQSYDIGFGVFLLTDPKQEKVDDMTTVLPVTKVNSQMVMQDGIIPCDSMGTYIVAFDNRYSWVHSKTLSYSVEVMQPGMHLEDGDVTKEANGDVKTVTEASEVTNL